MDSSSSNFILEALSLPFFRQALLIALGVSILVGIVGPVVITKRMSSLAGGLSHAAFGGIGIASVCGLNSMVGACLFCISIAVVLGVLSARGFHRMDSLISIMWSAGMAVGLVLVSTVPAAKSDLNSFLFGNILLVTPQYTWALLFSVSLLAALTVIFFKEIQTLSYDEEFFRISGVPYLTFLISLFCVIALATVLLIQIVGVVLSLALLTIPASLAGHWARSLRGMMMGATLASFGCLMIGLFSSYGFSSAWNFELPVGALTVLVCLTALCVSAGVKALRR